MIVGALAAGAAGGCCLAGISSLSIGVRTKSALPLLDGLSDLTFTLGYTIPLAQFLLTKSTLLYQGYDRLVAGMQVILADVSNNSQNAPLDNRGVIRGLLQRLGIFFSDRVDFDALMNIASHLPEATLREQFIAQLPRFHNQRISEIIARFPNILTIDFLAAHLSEDQFNAIVIPRLESPVTPEQLIGIRDDINVQKERLNKLAEGNSNGAEAEEISQILTQHTQKVLHLREFIRRLPTKKLPDAYAYLEDGINAARSLDVVAKPMLEELMAAGKDSLRERLQKIRSRAAAQEAAIEDPEDPNYEVLGSYGFRVADFKKLGNRLGVDLGDEEIKRTCQRLNECGLHNRGALIQHHILDALPGGGPLNVDTIIERIVQFCGGVPISQEVVVSSQSGQVEVAPQPRWVAVSRGVNVLFHVFLTGGLMAVQVYYLPIATLAGFVVRLATYNPRERVLLGVSQFFEPAPDYIHQGFQERMRYLYGRISGITWSLNSSGDAGGFAMGMVYGDFVRVYAERWTGRRI